MPYSFPRRIRAAALCLTLMSVGCSSSATSPDPVTESFSGTLKASSNAWHSFTTSDSGSILIQLTALGQPTIAVGLGLGVVSGSTCSLQYVQEGVTLTTQWATSVGDKGTYCLAIYDMGAVNSSTTYTLRITHP